MRKCPPKSRRSGFTLVELAVVVIIIGVLAAFAVPQFMRSVERSKAAEAFNYLSSVRTAQERFQARMGRYGIESELDIVQAAPKYFTVGAISPGPTGDPETSWQMTLTRTGTSSGYGQYTVTFNQDGFDPSNSTIPPEINPQG